MFDCLKKKLTKRNNSALDKIINTLSKSRGLCVYLNVYHLTIANYFLQFLGIGFFHTTIEVNSIEYSFIGTSDNNSGIFFNKFGENTNNMWLKEKIYLGNTIFDTDTIKEILLLNSPYWKGNSYDPFTKNCNHFTKFCANILLRNDEILFYPDYVNRITWLSTYIGGFYNPIKKLYLNQPTENLSIGGGRDINENNNNNDNSFNNSNVNYSGRY